MPCCIERPVNEKLMDVALYILEKCAHKGTFGKTVLFKLLYFSDFNFYKKNYRSITGEEYRRLDFGPAPCHFDEIIDKLKRDGIIEVSVDPKNGAHSFKVLKEIKITHLSKEEVDSINKTIEKLGNCMAKEISEISHRDTPWQVTRDKDIIDYDLVFYRDNDIALKVE
jgi:uncharacterized phage-associated protein